MRSSGFIPVFSCVGNHLPELKVELDSSNLKITRKSFRRLDGVKDIF